MKKVSVIIPCFNSQKYLEASLSAALKNSPHEIIVVDDCSTDNSVEIIRRFPVTLLQNETNKGPVVSRNRGAKRATGDILLFLDADAELAPDYAQKIAEFFDQQPQAGIVSGKILERQTQERIWYNFNYDSRPLRDVLQNISHFVAYRVWNHKPLLSIVSFLSWGITQNFVSDKKRKVDWVIEIAFGIKKEVFDMVGGFDENIFMYFEGPDLCRMVRKKGYETWYTPETTAIHLGGNTHEHKSEKRAFYIHKARTYYRKKYHQWL